MTQPLIVDPDRLGSASANLAAAAGEIPAVPPALSVPGTDALSVAIADGSEQIEAPLADLPRIKADATTTAHNVGAAGRRYAETDQELAARAARHEFGNPGPPGDGGAVSSAPSAGGRTPVATGGLGSGGSAAAPGAAVAGTAGKPGGPGQTMGMPMQMAQQSGQIPTQLAQLAGSAPQSVMQGAQAAVQQVAQVAGRFGKSSGDDGRPVDPASERQPQPEEQGPGESEQDGNTGHTAGRNG